MNSIIGFDTGLKSVLERASLVARSDVTVLLLGETGSGKEVLARYIHEESRRIDQPFVKVNCGAVPPELIDSYLFGHEKGAFTGAVEKRKGWFDAANGGTLFLDEIGELPLAAQVRFLRVLQDGSFEPVGGSGKSARVDVRVIAATHRNLREMVKDGNFREDLWYRISVFPIRIPPLRERPGDIEPLARSFVKRAAAKFSLPEIPLGPHDIDILRRHSWQGNVREFIAVIDRSVLLGNGERLAIAESLRELQHDIPSLTRNLEVFDLLPPRYERSDSPVPEAAHPPVPVQKQTETESSKSPREKNVFLSLDDAIRQHIEAALIRTRGIIEGTHGAAALLNVNPHTLRAKMRKLGIDWSKFRYPEV
ncbi:MAG: sigma-54 dependent transcriptional regulator [Planctomycetaceae bacterium]|jgi:transcriptional regulator with GAF, ATPase, and Fis domain|nr:sigma-54 dependent transcriptional regulator [Planctomycetaceae bacterium]